LPNTYRIEYFFELNHAIGDKEATGKLHKSKAVRERIRAMILRGMSIQAIMDMRRMYCPGCMMPFHRDCMAAQNMVRAAQSMLSTGTQPLDLQPLDDNGQPIDDNGQPIDDNGQPIWQ
ncbi:hypothetical protein BGZ76_009376, partial [Entomortierella beljakovae]